MVQPTATKQHIESRPGVCGGKPCIAGTRIRVQDIYVWHELQGKSADEIVSDFPELSHADVYAAMAYFWDNRDEIKRQMNDDVDFIAQMKAKAGPGLLDRIKDRKAGNDSVSS
jgi:uncharacterized protein (DUF433 family)